MCLQYLENQSKNCDYTTAIKYYDILLELDSDNSAEETLIDFYYRYRDNGPSITMWGIYIISKLISQYQVIFEYFKKNKTKVEWVKDYYTELLVNYAEKTDMNIYKAVEFAQQKYSDLFSIIESEIINKLEI